MAKKYQSEALEALHEAATGLHRLGLIDTKTVRDFDASRLTSVEKLSAQEIAEVRKKAGVSEAVFARYLNVTVGLVSQRERDTRNSLADLHSSCWPWPGKRAWTL